jgi:hypothetical protein
MLHAHYSMSSNEFIEQLRTYVIAMGLGPQVVDQVDRLSDVDEIEREHKRELQKIEDDTASETKAAILQAVNAWLEDQPNYDLIKAPCEALIKVIEAV